VPKLLRRLTLGASHTGGSRTMFFMAYHPQPGYWANAQQISKPPLLACRLVFFVSCSAANPSTSCDGPATAVASAPLRARLRPGNRMRPVLVVFSSHRRVQPGNKIPRSGLKSPDVGRGTSSPAKSLKHAPGRPAPCLTRAHRTAKENDDARINCQERGA